MNAILLSVFGEEEGLTVNIEKQGQYDELVPIMKQLAVDAFNELYFGYSNWKTVEACKLLKVENLTANNLSLYEDKFINNISITLDTSEIRIISRDCNARRRERLYQIKLI